jgi:hypothetical protein
MVLLAPSALVSWGLGIGFSSSTYCLLQPLGYLLVYRFVVVGASALELLSFLCLLFNLGFCCFAELESLLNSYRVLILLHCTCMGFSTLLLILLLLLVLSFLWSSSQSLLLACFTERSALSLGLPFRLDWMLIEDPPLYSRRLSCRLFCFRITLASSLPVSLCFALSRWSCSLFSYW